MAKQHLGRNPFDKRSSKKSGSSRSESSQELRDRPDVLKQRQTAAPTESRQSGFSSPAKWLLVDLPADTFTFAVKTAVWLRGVVKR